VVNFILPGDPWVSSLDIPVHIAGLHTIYNIINTLIFIPFVNQFAKLVTFMIRDKKKGEEDEHYQFPFFATTKTATPELNILRVEKEIRDMAGVVSSMYARFTSVLRDLLQTENKEGAAAKLCTDLKKKEEYTDEMMEALTAFLIECTREKLNSRSEHRVSQLLKVVNHIEEMSDDCYVISLLLEKSVRKNRLFKKEEMDELIPYLNQVGEFLELLQEQLGQSHLPKFMNRSKELESEINASRKKLQKRGRKRIEAGKDVKTELFYIDLVRRIEKLGDYCFDISNTLGKIDIPLYKRFFQKF